jgi:hypothetical protein
MKRILTDYEQSLLAVIPRLGAKEINKDARAAASLEVLGKRADMVSRS